MLFLLFDRLKYRKITINYFIKKISNNNQKDKNNNTIHFNLQKQCPFSPTFHYFLTYYLSSQENNKTFSFIVFVVISRNTNYWFVYVSILF